MHANMCATVPFLSQVIKEKFDRGSIILADQEMQRARNMALLALAQHDFDYNPLRMRVLTLVRNFIKTRLTEQIG